MYADSGGCGFDMRAIACDNATVFECADSPVKGGAAQPDRFSQLRYGTIRVFLKLG